MKTGYVPALHCGMVIHIKIKGVEVQRAERAAAEIFKLEENHAATFVTLGNIYAAVGLYDKAKKVFF